MLWLKKQGITSKNTENTMESLPKSKKERREMLPALRWVSKLVTPER